MCIPQLNGFFTTSRSIRDHLHHSCTLGPLNSKRPSYLTECEGLGLAKFTARLELLASLDKVFDLRTNGIQVLVRRNPADSVDRQRHSELCCLKLGLNHLWSKWSPTVRTKRKANTVVILWR